MMSKLLGIDVKNEPSVSTPQLRRAQRWKLESLHLILYRLCSLTKKYDINKNLTVKRVLEVFIYRQDDMIMKL